MVDAKHISGARSVKRVCIVRWHDGTAKSNWGGRATTLGIGRIIDRMQDHHISGIVNGEALVKGFEPRSIIGEATRVSHGLRARVTGTRLPKFASRAFGQLEQHAKTLAISTASSRLDVVLSALSDCDEVWVNGEGDFILRPRASLYRCLLVMHLAMRMGRPVRLINAMLSDPPDHDRDPLVLQAVARTVARCASVTYRDPESQRIHAQIMGDIPATWCPDALFSWSGEYRETESFGPGGERLPPATQQNLSRDTSYVAISGSSRIGGSYDAARADLRALVDGVREADLAAVIVATDSADHWMVEHAARNGWPFVPAEVPLATGLAVLGGAAALISGRYHPSILASVAGTPCAFMPSNSHKTESLQEMLGYSNRSGAFGSGDDVTAAVMRATEVDRDTIASRAASLSSQISWFVQS